MQLSILQGFLDWQKKKTKSGYPKPYNDTDASFIVWPMSLVCHGTLRACRGSCTNSTSNTRQVCVRTVNMWFRLEHEDNTAEVKAKNMLDPKAHILSIQDHY